MGRVARYKKTKAFDKKHQGGEYVWGSTSFAKKKKRSQTAERHHNKKSKRKGYAEVGGFDLPPGKDDFDLADLVVKKQKKRKLDEDLKTPSNETVIPSGGVKPSTKISSDKVKIGNKVVSCAIPQSEQEEKKMVKSLNLDHKTGKSSIDVRKQSTIEGRRQGESMNAFKRRLKEETEMALANDYKNKKSADVTEDPDKLTKSQRRKEYLKKKKMKKTSAAKFDDGDDFPSSSTRQTSDDGFITGEQAVARVSFLEQAEQPPVFKQLPRGAKEKSKTKKDHKGKSLDEAKIKAEQNAMEAMRRKVQAQYAVIKAKRRQEGKFHL